MTEAYNDALAEQAKKNMWDTLAEEAAGMSKLEYASVVADIAGIFDPSPVSDTVGGVLSAVQGDVLGVVLSVGSYIPYVGDAVAKPAKIAKRAPRTAKVIEKILKHGDNFAKVGKDTLQQTFKLSEVAAARRKALARVQQAMLDARNKVPGCKDCAKLVDEDGTRRVLQMPSSGGRWNTADGAAPASGSGVFVFDAAKTLPDGRSIDRIEFRRGAPDFTPYLHGQKYDLWAVTGDATKDADALAKQMRENGFPDWRPPSKKAYVLHHFEDGTVGYVPRELHDKAIGGASHTGGNSMINNQLF